MKKQKTLKYWETSHVMPAGNGLVYCSQCSKPVALTASQCPTCGSKEYSGFHKRRHAREETNDNVLIITTVSLTLLGIIHGIATTSGTFWIILAAAWQGTLGLLLGVPVGFAINFMRFFGRRGGLR
jgi:DNA-directed RNA polymerase subunit RPC12/RpoP